MCVCVFVSSAVCAILAIAVKSVTRCAGARLRVRRGREGVSRVDRVCTVMSFDSDPIAVGFRSGFCLFFRQLAGLRVHFCFFVAISDELLPSYKRSIISCACKTRMLQEKVARACSTRLLLSVLILLAGAIFRLHRERSAIHAVAYPRVLSFSFLSCEAGERRWVTCALHERSCVCVCVPSVPVGKRCTPPLLT